MIPGFSSSGVTAPVTWVVNRVKALLANAYNLFALGGTNGGLILTQKGVALGTSDCQISNTGGFGRFLVTSGGLTFQIDATNQNFRHTGGGGSFNGNLILENSGLQLIWRNFSTNQVGLKRGTDAGTGANILIVTDGSSGKGWLQNSSAHARLTGDVTNATATMANLTDLSLTLIAGRKYTGFMLIPANNSVAAEGLQFDFNGGAATMTSFEAGFVSTPPGTGLVLGTIESTALATALTATTATTANGFYLIAIGLVCNAAGTFIPRIAEVSHTTGTATAKANGWIWLEDSPN